MCNRPLAVGLLDCGFKAVIRIRSALRSLIKINKKDSDPFYGFLYYRMCTITTVIAFQRLNFHFCLLGFIWDFRFVYLSCK